jgi:hypothetical protein
MFARTGSACEPQSNLVWLALRPGKLIPVNRIETDKVEAEFLEQILIKAFFKN